MRLLLVTSLCLLFSQSYGGEASYTKTQRKTMERYRSMMNEFHANVKQIYRTLHNKVGDDMSFVKKKIEGSMAAVRSKREVVQPPSSPIFDHISSAVKSLQNKFDEAKNSKMAHDIMGKIAEFGESIRHTSSSITSRVRENLFGIPDH